MKSTLSLIGLLMCSHASFAAAPLNDAEPAVITSPAAAPKTPPPAGAPATPPSPRAAQPTSTGTTPASQSTAPAAPRGPVNRSSADRIDLGATQITGNSELPRVMYVVPWKRAELGDLAGRPAKSLLDEVLAPVDRDVFQRQNRYYEALQPDVAATAPKGEK